MQRRHDERGAVVIITAFSMLMVLAAVAMSVDIGQQVWRGRQMQAVADLAALDAVRAVGDQRDPAQSRCQQAVTIAQQSATRNNFPYSTSGYTFDVQLGTVDPTTKAWVALVDCTPSNLASNPSTANGVMVTAGRPVGFRFIPGTGGVISDAIATIDPKADIAMGTKLATVTASNLPTLDRLMGCMGQGGGTCSTTSSAGVTLVGYNGLVSSTIAYGDLFTRLNIGTTDQILNTQVSYKDMLNAAASTLNTYGGSTNVTAATALTTLALSANPTMTFKFGDIIGGTIGSYGQAAALTANVMDLVGASVEVANSAHLAEVDLPISIPNVASVHLQASVIEAPAHAYGPARQQNGTWLTTVHTAQVRTQLVLNLTGLSLLSGLVQLTPLTIYVESASGDGALTNIDCTAAPGGSVTINAGTNLVKIWVGQVLPTSPMTNTVVAPTPTVETLANVTNVAKITALGSITVPAVPTQDWNLTGPFTRLKSIGASTVSTSALANSSNLTITVQALGALGLGISAATVMSLLAPVITAVGNSILNVLSSIPGLGIQFGGADLWNSRVDCGGRKLVG